MSVTLSPKFLLMSIGNTDFNSYSGPFGGGFAGGFPGGFGGFGGGLGGFGLVGLVGLNNLFDRGRRDGDCDGAGGAGQRIFDATILSKLGNIEGQIGQTACNTDANVSAVGANIKDTIQNQTLFLQQQLATILLAGQQSAANTKDAIQNSLAITTEGICELNSSLQSVACSIKDVVQNQAAATNALINQIDRERLQSELNELRAHGRSRETEINVTQQVNQAQAQQQQQAQFNNLFSAFHNLVGELQVQRQGNRTVQFGAGNVATPSNTANQVGG